MDCNFCGKARNRNPGALYISSTEGGAICQTCVARCTQDIAKVYRKNGYSMGKNTVHKACVVRSLKDGEGIIDDPLNPDPPEAA